MGYDCDNVCLSDIDGDGVCDEFEIEGCMDSLACNYNYEATDNSACEYANSCAYSSGLWTLVNYPGPTSTISSSGENWALAPTAISYETMTGDWYIATFENSQLISECYNGDVDVIIQYNTNNDGDIIGDIFFTLLTDYGLSFNSTTAVDNYNLETGQLSGYVNSFTCQTCSGEIDGTGVVIDNDLNNDGICDDETILGCVYNMACNYAPSATYDDGSCVFPGDECVLPGSLGPDFDYGILSSDCECVENTFNMIEYDSSKKIIQIVDVLGRKVAHDNHRALFLYLFEDGSIEKKYLTK